MVQKYRNLFVVALAVVGMVGAKSAFAAADEFKIATVDMQKALQSVEDGKSAKTQLDKVVASKKKEIETEGNSIKKMHEDFKKQSLVMNEEARNKKQAEIQERFVKFQETQMRFQEELQKKEQELSEPIITKLRKIISETSKKKGYAMVIEKNEKIVLYSQEKDDLTSDVISTYNKGGKG
ncbi:OmpH family outer membrane protein [bacterium]|nr:OmpH family outer membrane protein [bacterium]